jgi:hypothetical protein
MKAGDEATTGRAESGAEVVVMNFRPNAGSARDEMSADVERRALRFQENTCQQLRTRT